MVIAMWTQLAGQRGYAAGSSGTVTIPSGAIILQIVAHATSAGASFTIYGGDAIPVPAGVAWQAHFPHMLWDGRSTRTVVFTGTSSYFVEYVNPVGGPAR